MRLLLIFRLCVLDDALAWFNVCGYDVRETTGGERKQLISLAAYAVLFRALWSRSIRSALQVRLFGERYKTTLRSSASRSLDDI
jgi:hypothetical protein